MSKKNKPPRPEPETLGLPLAGVDSHAHMDLDDFDADREDLLDRARACGVSRIGNVFLGPQAYHKNRHYFDHRPEVFFILGIHPGNADQCTPETVEAMRQAFAADPRLKALGVGAWAVVHCPEGAYGLDERGEYTALPSLRLSADEIKSTTGAGDAFCAGTLYGAHEGWRLADALRLGTAAAALSLGGHDTYSNILPVAESLRFYKEKGGR